MPASFPFSLAGLLVLIAWPFGAAWGQTSAEAQLYNDAESSPRVSFSLIEGGVPGGIVDGGGLLSADPLFADPAGPDGVRGTMDDDLHLAAGSPAVDAGSNDALPMDRADLDGDRETTDRLPVDLDRNRRVADGGGGTAVVDLGVYEHASPAQPVAVEDEAVWTDDYALTPAYPNPFNPETMLRFGVRRPGPVTVRLYDALGRVVRVLYDGTPAAGRLHPVRLDAGDLPSGVYFVRLTGDGFQATQEVTLVK